MKKYLVLLLGCASAVSLTSAARAQTDTGLSIDAEGYYYEFDEPGFDRSSGPYGRVGASYTGQYWDTFWTADAQIGGGVLDYRSGTAGNIDSYGNYSGEFRLIATRDFQFKPDGFYLSLFTGIGYKVGYDDTSGTTSLGNTSVDRLTQYLYWPLGFGLSVPITNSVTFKPSFEYDFLIDGNVDVETGGVGGISNNLRNDLNSGSGYRIALNTEVDTSTGRLSFGPFLRYWSVRVSDLAAVNVGSETVGFAFEPISHTWEAGFGAKLNFGAPPPTPAPLQPSPPLYVPPPQVQQPEPQREFQVFFDFNKYDLTGAARQVIKAAASTAKAGNAVHLVVTGHTDTVGSAQYNQGLSERRAAAVKNELVADGLPAGEIEAVGVGKTGLLVPTADGVREAQNRRATIEFGSNAGL